MDSDNTNIQYTEAKSILSKLNGTDNWFGITYNMNLYRGCQHGCIYCDTRSECYGINDISVITVKKNAIELLEQELSSKRRQKATIGTGSMNDPYMTVEAEMHLTQNALKVIARKKYPVHIITKSDLVTRDIDILQDISTIYAAVSFTITSSADDLSGKIEPHAPPTSARFKALSLLADKGIYTGITLMPLLPFINDTIQNLEEILQRAKDNGASYILPSFGLTLRKGSRDYFYKQLEQNYPGLRNKYEQFYQEQYICNSPKYRELNDKFMELTEKLKLDRKIKFFTPPPEQQLSLF